MKTFLTSIILFIVAFLYSSESTASSYSTTEIKDSLTSKQTTSNHSSLEWLNNGKVNYTTNGFLRSTANIINIQLGHPGKFSIPVYLMMGANLDVQSSNNLLNEETIFDILNNYGGLINVGINNHHTILNFQPYSKFTITYQLGVKSIEGFDRDSAQKLNFLSKVGSIGFALKSKVWTPDQPSNQGISWISIHISHVSNPAEKMEALFGKPTPLNIWQWDVGLGIEFGEFLKFNIGYQEVITTTSLLNQDIIKLSANLLLNELSPFKQNN